MSKKESRFAVCVKNDGYKASLEVAKLYRVIPDDDAARHGYVRVIDESGEHYAYSADRFFMIEVPQAVEKALLSVPNGTVELGGVEPWTGKNVS